MGIRRRSSGGDGAVWIGPTSDGPWTLVVRHELSPVAPPTDNPWREELPMVYEELPHAGTGAHASGAILHAYCDGGVYGASRSDVAAAWAYRVVDDEGKVVSNCSGVIVPNSIQPTLTNNYIEYVAAVRALEACSEEANVTLCADSLITIGRLLWGWQTNALPDKLVQRGLAAVARLGKVVPLLHDGHPTQEQLREGTGKRGNPVSEHNVWCDKECTRLLAGVRRARNAAEAT